MNWEHGLLMGFILLTGCTVTIIGHIIIAMIAYLVANYHFKKDNKKKRIYKMTSFSYCVYVAK